MHSSRMRVPSAVVAVCWGVSARGGGVCPQCMLGYTPPQTE